MQGGEYKSEQNTVLDLKKQRRQKSSQLPYSLITFF